MLIGKWPWNKNFTLLMQGQFASSLGTQAYIIACILYLKTNTNSATTISMLMMASAFMKFFGSMIGGSVADIYNKKWVMVGCDIVSGIFMIALGSMLLFVESLNTLGLLVLFIASMANAFSQSIYVPTMQSLVPQIILKKKITAANTLITAVNQFTTIIGQSLGSVFFLILGAPVLFLVNGISFVFSGISEAFINYEYKKHSQDEKNKIFDNMKSGIRYVISNKGLAHLIICIVLLNFAFSSFPVVLPFYLDEQLQLDPSWMGYVLSFLSVGTLVGAVLASVFKNINLKTAFFCSFFFIGFLLGLFGTVNNIYLLVVVSVLLGISIGFSNVMIISFIQQNEPAEYLGRIMGTLRAGMLSLAPIGILLSGVILDYIGHNNIKWIYLFNGCLILIIIIGAMLSSSLSDYLTKHTQINLNEKDVYA